MATEYLVRCSQCGNEIHSCWTNMSLEKLSREIDAEHHPVRQAKLVRAYKRKFDAFQEMMAKRPA